MMVCVTPLPAESVAVARSETYPVMFGCVTRTVRAEPVPVTVALTHVAPSSVEYCTVTTRSGAAVEPGWGTTLAGNVNALPAGAVFSWSRLGRKDTLQIGILIGSLASLLVGSAILVWAGRRMKAPPETAPEIG